MTFLYVGLRDADLGVEVHATGHTHEWVEQLRWGLDSIQQSVRFLLVGQFEAAAVIARGQLERWTENRAFNLNTKRHAGESSENYVRRIWQMNPLNFLGLKISTTEMVQACGEATNPGRVMRGLNGLIHAEQYVGAIDWANGGFDGKSIEAIRAARLVSDALLLAVEQLTVCISTLLKEEGKMANAVRVAARPSVPLVAISPLKESLWPVNLLLIQEVGAHKVTSMADIYEAALEGKRPAGRLYNDAEMMLLCFTQFRSRCIRRASTAFDSEVEMFGPRTQDDLAVSEIPPVVVSEMAAAVASWLPLGTPGHGAASAVADALRGSYWLWLEDDMRSMATLRVVLEQTARLRVWRLKPSYGAGLEETGSPARWLAKAGWGRLAALNRVLGEFSHFRPDVNWGGAFELLIMLNPNESPESARHTARRNALEVVTRLAAREICDQARCLNSAIGDAFDVISQEIFAGGLAVDSRIEEFLNHAQGYRSYGFPSTCD